MQTTQLAPRDSNADFRDQNPASCQLDEGPRQQARSRYPFPMARKADDIITWLVRTEGKKRSIGRTKKVSTVGPGRSGRGPGQADEVDPSQGPPPGVLPSFPVARAASRP